MTISATPSVGCGGGGGDIRNTRTNLISTKYRYVHKKIEQSSRYMSPNVATVLLLDACQHVTRHLHIYRRTDTQNKSFLLHYLLNNYANYVTNNFVRVNIIQNVVFRLLRHIIASYCGVIRGGAVGRGTALQAGKSRVRFPIVSSEFFIDIILPAAL